MQTLGNSPFVQLGPNLYVVRLPPPVQPVRPVPAKNA